MTVRRRIAVRGQAALPPRRYPYGPVNAGLATVTNWGIAALLVGKGQSVRDAAREATGSSWGFVLGVWLSRDDGGLNSGMVFNPSALENWHLDAAPRGGLRLFQGRPIPPAPHNEGAGPPRI